MKKGLRTYAAVAFMALVSAGCLSGCASSSADIVLHVYNCEDYIGEDPFTYYYDDGTTLECDDVLAGFEAWESEKLGKSVSIVYDTYETNETMLSSLKTGRSTYDLIVASDYAIQKMMTMGLLQKLDKSRVPNYVDYASPYLQAQLDGISATVDQKEESVGDYSLGYMWGTLGILYNPAKIASDKDMEEDQVKFDMASWESLWDDKYYGEMSVKDSMRDTFSIGIMKEFGEEIAKDIEASGCFDEDYNLLDGKWQEALDNYNPKLTDIFNRCDEESVEKVKTTLLDLKENIFGFEVDSGKEDMVKGMIGINLAWSGDAVFSMDTAEEGDDPKEVYYSIPKTGGNIWFDGWMMPKTCEGENQDVAYDFLDYLNDPQIAAANMNYIGYTPYVGGSTMLDLVREWYDPRYYEIYQYDEEEDDLVYDEETGEPLFNEGMDETSWYSVDWSEYEWDIVDLTYMFEGTLDDCLEDYVEDPEALGTTPETNPYLFYTDALEEIEDPETGATVTAGRQFFAQYPPQDLIPKLAIMKDYGDNNKYVLAMWQDVKSNNLPLAGVIVFAAILIAAAVGITTFYVAKYRYHRLRVERRKALNQGK